jgi:NADP-dependent 3-hydroxy acid dehydrogenase YdfG
MKHNVNSLSYANTLPSLRKQIAAQLTKEIVMRVWFITGASRGFGGLIAQEALNAGDAVVATARNPKGLEEKFGNHSNLLAVSLDVTDEASAHKATEAAVKRFGKIDILLNNAGFGLLGAVD